MHRVTYPSSSWSRTASLSL
uniref:Uncharacterized protein n=1 Tax=Amphimedon queenslandica TaxID=400682 RepID=A0A1X7U7I0_AMPQE